MLLSVVIPAYNEAATIGKIIERVRAVDLGTLRREIVVVDDASEDGTADVVGQLVASGEVSLVRQPHNRGKGAAVRAGFENARGDILVVQDADLEYDPADLPRVCAPILTGQADVVFGSRFAGGGPHRVLFFWHSVGNRVLTFLSNAATDLNLTDMECGYKAFRTEVIRSITLDSERFGFEPEVTAKVAAGRWRVYEVPVSYHGRTYAEGKKIGWKDGVSALATIARCAVAARLPRR